MFSKNCSSNLLLIFLSEHALDFSLKVCTLKALHLADTIKLVPSRLAKSLLATMISIVIKLFLFLPQC
jgi:hypothetical protein